MGLLSIFQSKSGAAPKASAPDSPADSVQQARTRARRRLIGAVVLVIVGVIGFPLLFETQPRPIPVDIPIEIPRKDGVPPLVMPAARAKTPVTAAPVEPAASDIMTETRADAGREIAPAVAAPASAAARPPEPVAAKSPAVAPKPAVKTPASVADSARAQALLEAKPPSTKDVPGKDGARYVVQVGAFADSAAARETRLKVEKLGLKTYTQVAETASGSRIRVRVGPFASRDEADRAMAKAKAAGVAAVVLTL
ncbi:SPOR domain-containing protein [Piscinibacter sp.]|jgi:DedD protein|uniref:SPOR domain-containing protein n=1 Tax=Piscinibacter sp. TaxID=1903157 RepID=UPI00355A6014